MSGREARAGIWILEVQKEPVPDPRLALTSFSFRVTGARACPTLSRDPDARYQFANLHIGMDGLRIVFFLSAKCAKCAKCVNLSMSLILGGALRGRLASLFGPTAASVAPRNETLARSIIRPIPVLVSHRDSDRSNLYYAGPVTDGF